MWKQLVNSGGSLYDLPGGNVGVGVLADEVLVLSRGQAKSERVIVFCKLLLQRDWMVRKGCDIHWLLKQRMNTWKGGHLMS